MRRFVLAAVVLLACGGSPERVPTQVTFRAKGLFLTGSDLGAPDGAMSQADNVVISRDGIAETRRGMEVRATKALARLFPYKDALVGHNSSTLSYSSDSGANWTDYGSAVTAPSGYPVRSAIAAANLFVTDATRPKRIDALAGTPEEAGVPGALDVELTLSSAGSPTAMPTDSQLAYRILFGKKDANGRLILGAPSSRGVIANTSGSTRDVTVGFSLPSGLTSSHFFQGYRTTSSVSSATDPGDEMGLVYEGTVPTAKTVTQLVRATNVVTATSTAHGFVAGQIVWIAPGGVVGSGLVAIGTSSAVQRSTDNGASWSGAGISGLSGTFYAVTSRAALYVAVGDNVCATSPDGLTWTARTIPAGVYYAVVWTGTRFVAVGTNLLAYSTDGTTWTAGTMASGQWKAITWTGSRVIAVGTDGTYGISASSSDGITWGGVSTSAIAGTFTGACSKSGYVIATVDAGSTGAIALGIHDGAGWFVAQTTAAPVFACATSGSAVVAVGTRAYLGSATLLTWTDSGALPGVAYSVAWDGATFAAVGVSSAATSPTGESWTTRTVAAGTYRGVCTEGSVAFAAGEFTIASVPGADTFTYAQTGSDGALVQNQTAAPLTGAFLDTTPDGFLGAALYTNENQQGILKSNDRPPLARDLAYFNGSLFLANITTPAEKIVYLLGVGGTNGMAADDTVTINGVAYTAKTAESIGAKQFKVYTTGTAAENIRDTALSLVRVVNRSLSTGATLTYVSTPEDAPGAIEFRNTAPSGNLTIAVSRTGSWSPTSVSEAPKTYKNGLVWSKQDQPDSFPREQTLVPVKIGADDEEIARIIPTRSVLFVLKTDGVWKVTGEAGNFSVQPFDPTIRIVAPETAAALDNTVFALSEQGVIRISDTGISVVSRNIESAILPLIAPAMRSYTALYAFAVGYESDRKFMLWLPTATSDTQATQAYVFDLFTQAWTRRTDDYSHAIVNPADDRLYAVDGTSAWQERKTLDDTDLADRSYAVTISSGGGTTSVTLADATNAAVGDALAQSSVYGVIAAKNGNVVTLDRAAALTNAAATVYKAIATAVKWSPRFGASPALLSELQEVVVFWDSVYFATASLGFATNISPAETSVTLSGSNYGWTGAANAATEIVVWPPREKSWGSQFHISLSHSQAWSPNAVSGLAVTFTSQSLGVSR